MRRLGIGNEDLFLVVSRIKDGLGSQYSWAVIVQLVRKKSAMDVGQKGTAWYRIERPKICAENVGNVFYLS